MKAAHLNKQVKLAVSEDFINDLLRFDFVSSKKGKRLGNVLLEKKQTGAKNLHRAHHNPFLQNTKMQMVDQMDEERDQVNDIPVAPSGGNAKLWYDRLNSS